MIPEPTSALGLWPRVRVISGWPQTNEDSTVAMADSLRIGGDQYAGAAAIDLGVDAWPDDAGREFGAATRTVIDKTAVTGADLQRLAAAATSFAGLVTGVKQGLNDLIAANLAPYASLAGLPPGIREVFEAQFVALLGAAARTYVMSAAGQAAALGQVTVSPPTGFGTSPGAPAASPLDAVVDDLKRAHTPTEIAAIWATLTDAQRREIAERHPDLVGSQHGAPAAARDIANRILLDRGRQQLLAERDQLEAELNSAVDRAAVQARIDQINGSLDGIDSIQKTLGPTPAAGAPARDDGYFLLGIDPAAEGRFIVAHGNPDTAANVATFVPGSLTNLSQAKTLLPQADALRDAAIKAGSDPGSTSVITWMDYNAPDTIGNVFGANDASSLQAAHGAADDLAQFQQGLRAGHLGPAPSHNSLVGHSYGSTVAGLANANANNAHVDEIIAAGSPGLGVQNADQLRTGRDHTWVIEHPQDPVADTGKILRGQWDPDQDSFGARVYDPVNGFAGAVDSDPRYYDQLVHDHYFDKDTPGVDVMGQIIAGKTPPN